MKLAAAPPYQHGQAARVGVLVVNLGTPDAPTPEALRRYLAEFLSDPRVVEIPALLWKAILHGVILRTRPAKSAAKYASIWTADGSPLRVWTERQAKLLAGSLGERGVSVLVEHAMRYGQPAVATQLDKLKAQGATRILVLPLYPQYSGATTASVIDAVGSWAQRTRHVPELRFVNHFHDDAGYLDALALTVRNQWRQGGRPNKLVISFHGMPRRTLELGDPYHCECHKTARLLALRLGLAETDYVVTFQSRFGRAAWLQPYTEPTLRQLAKQGVAHVDVICPGFVGDCIETLEEIEMEGKQAFLSAGGKVFNYIPCLNNQATWIAALARIATEHLQGWPTAPAHTGQDSSLAERALQRERALRLGAKH